MFRTIYTVWSCLVLRSSNSQAAKPPHLVMLVVDDLGWNDVPWNNPDALSVRMGFHARQGVILDRHYVTPKCSPSRASLLTGRYAWKMGVQRGAIERYQPTGLSTNFTLLPQRLKEAGYVTHAVGKWHLGYCNEKYLPTRRGFDTFFGIYQQAVNYRSRLIPCASFKFRKEMIGYDLRRNESVTTDYRKMYSTEMYSTEARTIIQKHNPSTPMFLYVPFMALHTPHVGRPPKKLRSLLGRKRKKNKDDLDYFDAEGFGHEEEMRDAVLVAVDQAVHEIISELKSSGLYENSVILVTTDNGGGPPSSNSPLTGGKESLYEGGIRGASFLLSPLLANPGTKYKGLLHLSDWYPTFLGLAGLEAEDGLDGIDQWKSLNKGESERTQIIHNIDEDQDTGTFQACIQAGEYKMIWGQDYLLKQHKPQDRRKVRLYNTIADPSENNDISEKNPQTVKILQEIILKEKNSQAYTPAIYPSGSSSGLPSNFDGVISSGWC